MTDATLQRSEGKGACACAQAPFVHGVFCLYPDRCRHAGCDGHCELPPLAMPPKRFQRGDVVRVRLGSRPYRLGLVEVFLQQGGTDGVPGYQVRLSKGWRHFVRPCELEAVTTGEALAFLGAALLVWGDV
jgi:hypothetical protein